MYGQGKPIGRNLNRLLGAERHASRYTRNPADMFIYDLNDGGNIILVKTILHNKQEEHE
tara:strand:- start:885 stop:1061 length:177 start_codon:yes stop_codon:yes gene_type:complete